MGSQNEPLDRLGLPEKADHAEDLCSCLERRSDEKCIECGERRSSLGLLGRSGDEGVRKGDDSPHKPTGDPCSHLHAPQGHIRTTG